MKISLKNITNQFVITKDDRCYLFKHVVKNIVSFWEFVEHTPKLQQFSTSI